MTRTLVTARPRTPSLSARRVAGGACAKALIVWSLILALVIHGGSGVLLQILGPMHRHAESHQLAEAFESAVKRSVLIQHITDIAEAVHEWRERVHARTHFADERSHGTRGGRAVPAWISSGHDAEHVASREETHAAAPQHGHTHSHGLFERHVHAIGDATVVAIDGHGASNTSDGPSAAALAGLHLLMHMPPLAALPDASADPRRIPWPSPNASTWRSADLKSLKRPPRA